MSAPTTAADDFHPGQLVMVGIAGETLDDAQAAFLRHHHVRAVVLFRDNLRSEGNARALTADLREVMGSKALIGLDQEGGAVLRATFLPQPPAAMALGAAGDASLAYDVGAAVARGIRSIGFNWNFAPVLDVNNNPENPVIAERSFSSNPEDVARLGAAWMRGALSERVACCVKHFPGHGDTHVDSHFDLPVVDKPRESLDMLELVPFRKLRGEAPAMMTAHIVYPRIDPRYPATLSRAILGGVLRDEWHYGGVVITDSLVMNAIRGRYGTEQAVVLALQAGADMVMALGSVDEQAAAIAAIERALDCGELDRRSVLRARARLDALAGRFPVDPFEYSTKVQRKDDDDLMRRAWARGLTALGGAKPPPLDQPIRIITQRYVPGDGVSEPGLSGERVATLFERFETVDVMQVDDLCALDWSKVALDRWTTVLASNVRARYGKHARAWRPNLHLVLWNPFQALDVAAPTIVTWGYANGALDALRRWLEGRGDAPGKAPVPLESI